MFFKPPKPDISGVAAHGKQFDVVNGFIEVLEEEFTPAIEATLKSLGFEAAKDEEVSAAVTEFGAAEALKNEAAERAALIEEIKSWGLRVDGRKGLAWLKERYEEFVAQGHIRPGEKPGEVPAPAAPEPVLPLKGGTPAAVDPPVPEPVFEDDPAAKADDEGAAGEEADAKGAPAAV